MPQQFDHEKLNVYQEALRFVAVASAILERVPKGLAVQNQLDHALECAACVDVLVVKKVFRGAEIVEAKGALMAVVSMLVGLTKAIAPGRVREEADADSRESGEE